MLDTPTKRRIDDCRDILVGKLPDPKSQIEQITIALIYKFMNDMDRQNQDLGGEAKFFTGEFEKYSWDNLFDAKVTSTEMLNLYMEAIEKMELNPNIPELFRSMFKNAYLPYRDPETLRLFLKTIGKFEYTHSEKLGDAFEYLLSVMGSQGDAGQFRTPRHIIDFIVEVVDPGKKDRILDPACGTAGFLISAYNYIRKKNNNEFSPDEKKRLIENSVGYDISPDMVRLSLVNLYLHQFSDPHIYEYDTLSSEERWSENFDVILANPPFMSPKGGIKPHKKFSIQSNRAEVLFVDYIMDHLTPKGKAGIIVPDGIIFQSNNAYTSLRKKLVSDALWAVVSLPSGVFNPYSGVKTSILLIDKELSKMSDSILFVKIENDGFSLGAQRTKQKGNQLPQATDKLNEFKECIKSKEGFESSLFANEIAKTEISEEQSYNLSGSRYFEVKDADSQYKLKRIDEVAKVNPRKSEVRDLDSNTYVSFVPMSEINEWQIDFSPKEEKKLEEVYKGYTYFKDGDVLIAKVTPCFENGKAGIAKGLRNGIGFGSSELYVLRAKKEVLPEWLFYMTSSEKFHEMGELQMTGTGGLKRVPKKYVESFEIPLPSLDKQKEIVEEIDEYREIIRGAKIVVDRYKPKIKHNENWRKYEIGDVFDTTSGGTPLKEHDEYYEGGNIPWLRSGEVSQGYIHKSEKFITKEGLQNSSAKLFPKDTVLIAMYGATAGQVGILKFESTTNQAVCGILPNDKVIPEFLYLSLLSQTENMIRLSSGGAQPNISQTIIKKLKVPIPSIKEQQKEVDRIKEETTLINSNKQLIKIFKKKIDNKISEILGENQSEDQ